MVSSDASEGAGVPDGFGTMKTPSDPSLMYRLPAASVTTPVTLGRLGSTRVRQLEPVGGGLPAAKAGTGQSELRAVSHSTPAAFAVAMSAATADAGI